MLNDPNSPRKTCFLCGSLHHLSFKCRHRSENKNSVREIKKSERKEISIGHDSLALKCHRNHVPRTSRINKRNFFHKSVSCNLSEHVYVNKENKRKLFKPVYIIKHDKRNLSKPVHVNKNGRRKLPDNLKKFNSAVKKKLHALKSIWVPKNSRNPSDMEHSNKIISAAKIRYSEPKLVWVPKTSN